MKQEIEAAVHPLIGEPLSGMMRYAGCHKFEFGVQMPAKNHKGEDFTLADRGLVVSCDWGLTGAAGRHIVSAEDFGPGRERRDEGAKFFYDIMKDNPPLVEEIQVAEGGGLRFYMADGYLLEIIPNGAASDERWPEYAEYRQLMLRKGEQWRLMRNRDEAGDAPHFVVTAEGTSAPES